MREARVINWGEVEARAKKMPLAELIFAYKDCVKASNLNMPTDGYYSDCASVYYTEMKKKGYKDFCG